MQIKTYQAPQISEALKMIKREMGPDALIISTKRKHGNIKGFLCKDRFVEVTAAIDHDLKLSRSRLNKKDSNAVLTNSPFDKKINTHEAVQPHTFEKLKNDIAELKGMFLSLNSTNHNISSPLFKDPVFNQILAFGINADIAVTLMENFKPGTSDKNNKTYRKQALDIIMQNIVFHDRSDKAGNLNEYPQISIFSGPTGVGKTTTIAKLASESKIQYNKKVAVINLDTYRIGATEQLKTYTDILKLPFKVAASLNEFNEALEAFKTMDLILVDTAGRSQWDSDYISNLSCFFNNKPEVRKYLLISATTKEKDVMDIDTQFSKLDITDYIFTKLDETGDYAPLFNLLLKSMKPVSYLTNGQRVPEDIIMADRINLGNLFQNK